MFLVRGPFLCSEPLLLFGAHSHVPNGHVPIGRTEHSFLPTWWPSGHPDSLPPPFPLSLEMGQWMWCVAARVPNSLCSSLSGLSFPLYKRRWLG